jgi:hypothetical protein
LINKKKYKNWQIYFFHYTDINPSGNAIPINERTV